VKTIRFSPDFSASSPLELRLFLEVQTVRKRHAVLEAVLLCLQIIERIGSSGWIRTSNPPVNRFGAIMVA
jgi:hypothetical protein